MDNINNRRMWISSLWKFTFSLLALLMLFSKTTAYSTSNFKSNATCDQDLIFNNRHLRELSCYSYTEIPTNIENPDQVISLDMGKGNSISLLTNYSMIHSKLTSLKILILEFCKIRVVEPDAFKGSDELEHIYLNDNLITVLNPEIFAHAKNLRYLHLENNPIKFIESGKIFPSLPKLVTLDLSNCMLESISTNVFDKLDHLKGLYLKGNPLKHSNLKMLRSKSNLASLNLGDNQWHCDCYTKFLLQKMSEYKGFENITCDSANNASVKREKNMKCQQKKIGLPHSFVASSSWTLPPTNNSTDDFYRAQIKHIFVLYSDVYFECTYKGASKSDMESLKNNQSIRNDLIAKTQPAKIQSESLKQDKVIHKDQDIVGEITVVRRIQVKGKGTYTCILFHKHGHVLKAVYSPRIDIPGEENGTASSTIWIFVGLMIGVLGVAVAVIVWIKGYKQQATFGLGEFNTKSTSVLLTLASEDKDASRI